MCKSQSPPTLEQLLNDCSDPISPCWQCGWNEFIRRYKLFIYKKVIHRCKAWNVPRLGLQFSETVNDVVAEIYTELCKNQCEAFRKLSVRNNEQMFFAWLATICNRAASRHVQKYFNRTLSDIDQDDEKKDYPGYFANLESDLRWELYETLIGKLRASGQRKRRNMERDINIFLQHTWADFSPEMISYHPCLSNVKPQLVFVVVARVRSYLRRDKNF
jgi:hypothetical protein